MIERTFVAIKPDGVQRGLVGEIIKRLEQRGLKLIGMKMKWADKEFAKQHYADHVEKGFYPGLEKYITSGPVVAMVVEGVHAVEVVRKIVGPLQPKEAAMGTIRGDFAHESSGYADSKNKSIANLIHASGKVDEAEKEISLWFSQDELYKYDRDDWKTMHEAHE